jgi:hypothetical protein
MYLEEYIVELRQARQWKSVKPSVEAGDLVLLVETDVLQCHWQLTVVKEVPSSVYDLFTLLLSKSKLANAKTHHPT